MIGRTRRRRAGSLLVGVATIAGVLGFGQLPAAAATGLAINDVSVVEGNSGTINAVFTVTRSDDTTGATTVDFTTTDLSATAGTDYTTTAGTLSFAPGQTTATITVPVVGDVTKESNELFLVDLSNASGGATIGDAQAFGIIFDDDQNLFGGGPGSGSQFGVVDNTSGTTNGQPTGGTCSGRPGLGIIDAALDPIGTSPRGAQFDAYDRGLQLFVNNNQFAAPPTFSATSANPRLDSAVAGPVALAGLDVTVQYKALQFDAVLRTIAAFTNTSGADITVPVVFQTNVGSDELTGTRGTSSGDAVIGPDDRWIVTSDSATTPGDPVNTHVLAGPGTPAVTPSAISATACGGVGNDEGIQGTFNITVPAGATRSLMFFNGLSQTNATGVADAQARYSTNPVPSGGLLSDLSETQLSQLLNWSVAPLKVTKTADSPTSTAGGTNGYAVSVANPNQDSVDVASITDTLPAGFTYTPGSSTFAGAPIADPSISGRTLTWTGPFTVAAASTRALRFGVNVGSSAGTFTNSAAAAATGYTVAGATDVAPVQVSSSPAPPTSNLGYRLVAADGGIFTFGDRNFHGSTGDLLLNKPIVGGATDLSDNDGYWIVASDGGVFTFSAPFFGSLGDQTLASPAVEIESTPTGKGYWIVLADGKVFAFGDAKLFGDVAGKALNKPIIGMSVTPSGQGYWLVAGDGGIFNFGDAGFFGSTGDKVLNAPIIDLAPSVDNQGYYLLGSDGGVFTFGSADFKGSTGDLILNAPVVAMLVAPNGAGYWLGASDGGIFTFGAVPFLGSMGGTKLNSPVLDLIS